MPLVFRGGIIGASLEALGAPTRDERGPAKGRLKNGGGACARQGRGVRRRSAPFRSCSSLGFGLLEGNRRAVQRFARLCSSLKKVQRPTKHSAITEPFRIVPHAVSHY